MNLQQLFNLAQSQQLNSLELIALEGGNYVLQAITSQRCEPVLDDQGKVLHLRSMTQARDVLQGITPVPFHLVQQVVQDEACGLGGGPQEPMRLPISLQSAW
ncbi:DUF6482 family protein [Metapseudomonas otitidis]|uniref:DUF6482 family protein n=1 Tax=Metapseudomonas otitidis TaxID=319939 RepID=UPI0013F698AB|nr:DUF6482 family protein [Pseudomonas otitidis]